MENYEQKALAKLTLAPWIQKSTTLISKPRRIGGNMFRHQMATMSILMDYHYFDSVLLKASICHDIFEDIKDFKPEELMFIDTDSPEVIRLIKEVTKRDDETKAEFLERILNTGSVEAKILKCADRISNLTDLSPEVFSPAKMKSYIEETLQYVLPMARQVNNDMVKEIEDLSRQKIELALKYRENADV
jgi:hypothetical protein